MEKRVCKFLSIFTFCEVDNLTVTGGTLETTKQLSYHLYNSSLTDVTFQNCSKGFYYSDNLSFDNCSGTVGNYFLSGTSNVDVANCSSLTTSKFMSGLSNAEVSNSVISIDHIGFDGVTNLTVTNTAFSSPVDPSLGQIGNNLVGADFSAITVDCERGIAYSDTVTRTVSWLLKPTR